VTQSLLFFAASDLLDDEGRQHDGRPWKSIPEVLY
jgi:hypothetical protein